MLQMVKCMPVFQYENPRRLHVILAGRYLVRVKLHIAYGFVQQVTELLS